jgi:hypothetical protein
MLSKIKYVMFMLSMCVYVESKSVVFWIVLLHNIGVQKSVGLYQQIIDYTKRGLWGDG